MCLINFVFVAFRPSYIEHRRSGTNEIQPQEGTAVTMLSLFKIPSERINCYRATTSVVRRIGSFRCRSAFPQAEYYICRLLN